MMVRAVVTYGIALVIYLVAFWLLVGGIALWAVNWALIRRSARAERSAR